MNPNIALSFQRPRFDPMEGQRNALAARSAQLQEAAALHQIQAGREAAQLRAGRRNALAGVDWENPEALRTAGSALGKAGDIDAALQVNQYLTALDEKTRLRTTAEITAFKDVAPLLTSPDTYAEGYAMAQQVAPSLAARLPAQFTPDIAPGIERMALGAKGWLDKQQSDRSYKLEQEKLARQPTVGERKQIAAAGRSQFTVNNAQETAERRAFGKSLVSEYDAARERADTAISERQTLEMLRNIDVETGRLEEFKSGISAFAQALGLDPEKIGLPDPANPQAFIATAQNLVLRVMQAQKGVQTENDAKRIEATVANLKNAPAARDFLINSAIALRERDIEQADFYDAWRERTGSLEGARKAWRVYVNKTPLLGNNPVSGLPVFYNEFREKMREANPGASDDQILMLWRKKYGG